MVLSGAISDDVNSLREARAEKYSEMDSGKDSGNFRHSLLEALSRARMSEAVAVRKVPPRK